MASGDFEPGLQEAGLLRALVDKIPAMLAYWDSTSRCRFANRAYERWFGVSPEDLIGKHIRELLGPLYQLNLPYIEGALRGEPQEFEREIPDPAGGPSRHSLATYIPDVVDGVVRGFFVTVTDISAIKRAEMALRESEERFRLAEAKSSGILSISADAIISIDRAERITLFNEGAEAIFGYPRAEAIGAPLDILIPERFRALHRHHIAEFAAGHEVARRMSKRDKPILGLRKNGEEFPADATISKLEIGGERFLTVALRDMTEQKRAQDQIRQSQERFELALQGADLASWDWNIETGEVIFNARWAEMRGFRPEEVRPHVDSWISGVHQDDRKQVDAALQDHFRGLRPVYETEHRVRTKSGQWLWILDRGKVFARDEHGRPIRMAGTELDITERKRIQDQQSFLAEVGTILAASLDFEETLAAIARLAVRQLADCVMVDVADDGDQLRRLLVVHADPAKALLCKKLERFRLDRRRPHLGSAIIEATQPTLTSEMGPDYVASMAQDEDHLRLLRELDPRSMMAVPLRGRDRLLGGLLFISSTTRRYAPPDLDLAKELALRAALAIDNARLYETARRATQVRDDLLGIVAHDLRNPLSAILMQTERLHRRGAEPERRDRKAVDAIGRAAGRANRLIQDLLDVTRMEAGRLSVERAGLAARQVASDAVEAQETLASSASVALRLDVPENLPELWADRDRLLQIFENLIGNAVKFTPPGGTVTVAAAPQDNEVVFSVADTGAGIAPDDLPHLFDRFWQAHKAERRGAGLGLPIVKGIVEAHGGRIWVESTPGRGSTFFFTIPTTASGPDLALPCGP